ncbi:AAA family ATPase [Streptomyces sp. NPDC002574]|uniref:helix-turn-helix transcriptional regulator n=1 Tax=Streptomyces sp. NPDC002574 TaxID=3364652 RepID=UPI00367F718E
MGRRRERAALSGWLDAALDGEPRLVLCGGEPGIGKTRLAMETAAMATAAGAATRWARAHEGIGTPPFWLWRQLLRSDPALPGTGSKNVLDMIEANRDADRFALFDAIVRQVFALAERSGLLLVVEDAQWADEPSLLLLRYLARELRGARVLVLVTYRTVGAPDAVAWRSVLPDLGREPATVRLPLAGLGPQDTALLVEAVTGQAAPGDAAGQVYRLTAGNPFFARELAGTWATEGGSSDWRLPASLVDVIEQRTAGLSGPARRVLTAAAVLGEQFSVAVTAAMVERPAMSCLPLLEEAERAGLIAAADTLGEWRFTHALLCEAIEARTPGEERARLHRAAAETIERIYAEQIDDRSADIARHWAAASLDDPSPAVTWGRRAGDAALRSLAYEESARLYRLALDAGGPSIEQQLRCRLLIDLAHAHWRATDIEPCRAAIAEAVTIARRIGRPDLMAEAALGVEPIGSMSWDLSLRQLCEEALAGVDPAEVSLRARLLGRSAEAAVYTNEIAAAESASGQALTLADETVDPAATIAALKSRQLCLAGPEHIDERRVLARRMTEIGLTLRRPREEMLGRLWQIDTHWERGDLAAIAAELPRLGWCVEHVGGPIARWHPLTVRAALAAAHGRFDEALGLGRAAFDTIRATNHPTAFGAYMSLLCALAHHAGHDRVAAGLPADLPSGLPVDRGEVRDAIFGHVGAAFMLTLSGKPDAALDAYRGAGPVHTWQPPPYFRVLAWAYGSLLAVTLGQVRDVEYFHDLLRAEQGRFVVAGAGTASYLGPVELHLGRAAAFLGRLDDAVTHLDTALAHCHGAGAAGFAVEAEYELAAALTRRAATGDADRARLLLDSAESAAVRIGMPAWAQRARDLLGTIDRSPQANPLSPRETEVAELVAQGMTNRGIAGTLFISERTAQTHVQHILTKLGFSTRTQIAAWVHRPAPGRHAGPAAGAGSANT